MKTGAELQAARLARRLSVCELGGPAGITHKTLQYREAKPALDLKRYAVKAMADALGVSLTAGEFPDTIARARGVLSSFVVFNPFPEPVA